MPPGTTGRHVASRATGCAVFNVQHISLHIGDVDIFDIGQIKEIEYFYSSDVNKCVEPQGLCCTAQVHRSCLVIEGGGWRVFISPPQARDRMIDRLRT